LSRVFLSGGGAGLASALLSGAAGAVASCALASGMREVLTSEPARTTAAPRGNRAKGDECRMRCLRCVVLPRGGPQARPHTLPATSPRFALSWARSAAGQRPRAGSAPMNPPPADGHSDRPNGSVPAHATLPSAVRTLPPPAWSHLDDGPLSVASLALEQGEANRPIERRGGPPAILCGLEARLYQARAGGDGDQERQAALDLARGLAARGTELDTAIKLARRAL